jgi:hypothetical protein
MKPNPEYVLIPERRLKSRTDCNYPTRIKGVDCNGVKFELEGRSTNISRNGLYILLDREIPVGAEVSIRLAVPTGLLDVKTSNLAVTGVVMRNESKNGSGYGIAIKFKAYRFF